MFEHFMNQCLALATVAVKDIISWIFLVYLIFCLFLKIISYLLSVKKHPRKYNVQIIFFPGMCKNKRQLVVDDDLTTPSLDLHFHHRAMATNLRVWTKQKCDQDVSINFRERKLQLHFPRLYVATLLVYFEVGGVLLCLSPSCF